MAFWIAKSKRQYTCDICGREISRGEKRLVYGLKSLAYTMIDRNVCLGCLRNIDENDLVFDLNITQSLESFDEMVKELYLLKKQAPLSEGKKT
jgi:hypothetical protein